MRFPARLSGRLGSSRWRRGSSSPCVVVTTLLQFFGRCPGSRWIRAVQRRRANFHLFGILSLQWENQNRGEEKCYSADAEPGKHIHPRAEHDRDLQTLYSLWRRRAAVTTLRRRSRVFVILSGRAAFSLERANNFAEEALLSPCLFLRLDTGARRRVPVRARRRQRFLGIAAKYAREEPLHAPAALVAGIVGLGAGHKGNCVIVGTRRRRQAVGDFVELYIHHAFRLEEGL